MKTPATRHTTEPPMPDAPDTTLPPGRDMAKEQAARYDRQVQRVLLDLRPEEARKLALAAGVSASATDAQVRRFLGLQLFRARTAGVLQQTYNDVLAGRRGSVGTVMSWCVHWRAYRYDDGRSLPPLDYVEILGLESALPTEPDSGSAP